MTNSCESDKAKFGERPGDHRSHTMCVEAVVHADAQLANIACTTDNPMPVMCLFACCHPRDGWPSRRPWGVRYRQPGVAPGAGRAMVAQGNTEAKPVTERPGKAGAARHSHGERNDRVSKPAFVEDQSGRKW